MGELADLFPKLNPFPLADGIDAEYRRTILQIINRQHTFRDLAGFQQMGAEGPCKDSTFDGWGEEFTFELDDQIADRKLR